MIGISGGSGYIGSWLARKFLENGESVRIIDFAPPPDSLQDRVEYFKADINDRQRISSAVAGCDVFYHLAAVVSKVRGAEDRYNCIETNIAGTLNVLEACLQHRTGRVVYMGTSEVLGEPYFVPTDERHSRHPKTTYGITKCAGEDLCYEYNLAYGLNVVMPRLYMIYGIDDMRPFLYHNVVVKFVWNVLNDKPPLAFHDCIRTFLYITDCVEALFRLKDRGKPGEIYDICDRPEHSISMEDLARRIISLCGKDMEPTLQEPPPTDTRVKLPSGYKAYAELNWVPQVTLDDGLKRVVDWMKRIEDLP